jgi:signal transduction histidine kinase/HAMP domain-containing protein
MAVFTKSLHRKILVLILIVGLVPAIAGVLQAYWGSIIAMDSTLGGYLQNRATTLASGVDELLRRKMTEVLDLVNKPEFETLYRRLLAEPHAEMSEEQKTKILAGLVRNTVLADDTVILTTLAGEAVASSRQEMTMNFGDETWWQEALRVGTDKIYFAEGTRVDTRIPYTAVASPLTVSENGGKKRQLGMVVVMLDQRRLLLFLDAYSAAELGHISLYSSRDYFVFNPGQGQQLDSVVSSHLGLVQSKLYGWFTTQRAGEMKHVLAFSVVKSLRQMSQEGCSNFNWFIFMDMDMSDIMVVTNLLLWRATLIGFGLVVLMCVLGFLLSSRIVKPIKLLRHGVEKIAQGDLDSRVQIRTNDEIQVLAESVNNMADKLKQTYYDLARKIMEIDEKAHQIALINEISRAINAAFDLERIYEITTREIRRLVDYDRASITLLDEDGSGVRFEFVVPSVREGWQQYDHLSLEGTNIGHVILTKQPLIKRDIAEQHDALEDELLLKTGMKSFIIVPLISHSGVIGTFNLSNRRRGYYGAKEQELLLQVAEPLAVAIEHSRLYARIRKFAEELEVKVQERTRDLEQAQIKLIQTEKFVAMGQLAANLAHEINNPLAIMNNYLRDLADQLKEEALEKGPLALENLEIVKEELDRIARIVKSLLNFYKPADQAHVPIDINYEILQLVKLMEKGFREKRIRVALDLQPDLPQAVASRDLIRQVFLNLLRNAEDAMENGGELGISTYTVNKGEGDHAPQRIAVIVADTGCGIPREHIKKIFDPFFTTKKGERGTGLGLWVTYGILQSMEGTIEIESEEAKGTTVRVTLPT